MMGNINMSEEIQITIRQGCRTILNETCILKGVHPVMPTGFVWDEPFFEGKEPPNIHVNVSATHKTAGISLDMKTQS